MKDYLPTPKMFGVISTGLVILSLLVIAEVAGVADDVRPSVAVGLALLVETTVGWFVRDNS